jgi:hypothetical protein
MELLARMESGNDAYLFRTVEIKLAENWRSLEKAEEEMSWIE